MTVYNTLIDPWDQKEDKYPERLWYPCPHCGKEVEQASDNFHWWCTHCGRNATNPVDPLQKGLPTAEWASQSGKAEGVWHRIASRTSLLHEMRCGFRVPADEVEIADGLANFKPIDSYCATCFYTPNP